MSYVLFLVVSLIWGANFLLMKKSLLVFGPVSVGVGRCLGGAAAIALVLAIRRSFQAKGAFGAKEMRYLLLPASIGIAYPWVLQPALIGHYGNSAFFGMMVCLVPLLTMFVSVPMLGVYPKPRQIAGVLGGLIGMALLFKAGDARGIGPVGVALAVTVPLSYAISNNWVKRHLSHVPPVHMTGLILMMATLGLLPIALASESIQPTEAQTTQLAAGSLLVLGVVGTGLTMAWFMKLVMAEGPLFAGMTTYIVPCGALAFGALDGEPIDGTQIAALVLVLAMVALVQWPERAPKDEAGLTPPAE